MTDLQHYLDELATRRPVLIDLGLTRMHATLARLGDPHRRLPPVLHVAGTNGKGSTVAYIRSILEASGARVHVYTSPHLVRFNERIRLAGTDIGDAHLVDLLTRCDAAAGETPLSFFEAATCAAFLGFAETPADYVVLEVGLGGRLDATNVVDRPAACVITPIALDHQSWLGETLAEIAGEKAGIFRAGAPAVVGQQAPAAMGVLEAKAREVAAAPFVFGAQWQAFGEHGRLIYQDDDGLCDLDPPRLIGAHQIQNAGLAVAAVKAAQIGVDDDTISRGLVSAHWPARLQRLTEGPDVAFIAARAGRGSELWLDGGHNPHAGRAVAAALSGIEERSSARLVMIAGMQTTKDMKGYFAPFAGLAASVLTVRSANPHAATADAVAEAAEAAGLPAFPCGSLEEALELAVGSGQERLRVIICGSLYLAGEVLARAERR